MARWPRFVHAGHGSWQWGINLPTPESKNELGTTTVCHFQESVHICRKKTRERLCSLDCCASLSLSASLEIQPRCLPKTHHLYSPPPGSIMSSAYSKGCHQFHVVWQLINISVPGQVRKHLSCLPGTTAVKSCIIPDRQLMPVSSFCRAHYQPVADNLKLTMRQLLNICSSSPARLH